MTNEQNNLYFEKLKKEILDNNLNIDIPAKDDDKFRYYFLNKLMDTVIFSRMLSINDEKAVKEYEEICIKYLNDEITFWRLCFDYVFVVGVNNVSKLFWSDFSLCIKEINHKE